MALSTYQIALFGQVRVELANLAQQPNKNLVPYTTLLEIYKAGWWVTERFGTLITLVKERKYSKDGFACLQRRIKTSINLDSLDREIQKIADRKFEQYKSKLLDKKKITRTRVKPDDLYMPTLSQKD